MQVCPGCGEASPDRFSECPFCGTALAERREAAEERKVLTVVFCDLKDSTGLGERLDPESLGEVLDLYFTAMTRVLKRHGGAIQKFIGDAVVAAFGIPVIHEDDALRAVRAAVEMRESMARLNRQLEAAYGVRLQTRTGVHTGEVVIRTAINEQQVLTGDTLNTAARLEQGAGSDEILVGGPTYRLVRDAVEAERLEPLELKGKAQPVAAYRLLRVFGDEQASRRHDAPIVGREEELGDLLGSFSRAVEERSCHLTTVVGEAGVGKSRLVRALVDATGDEARILHGRCPPYGEGGTFWPLLNVVRDAAEIAADDPAEVATAKLDALADDPEVTRRVASALGWSNEELPVAELFWGIRELLECMAQDEPLVVVIDDVHWAPPTLLELIEHLVETVEDGPMLVLATARPDMLEGRPGWSDRPRARRLILDRLPDGVTEQVIENLLDGVRLPDGLRAVIVGAAEGNPLFVEQLVSMLVDSKVLVEVDGSWRATRPIERLEIPPSIQALLTARLDMLSPEERRVAEPAAVIGLEFPSLAVRELVPADERDRLPIHLERLARRQLVRPAPPDEREFDDHRFHHVLIRDAAYQRALKRARADLHERFAGWLEDFDGSSGRPGEHDEVVGYHLEQAHAYRSTLGPVDVHVRVIGARGAEKLAAAGRRAFVRGDLPAATSLLERAIALLPAHDAVRLALLPDLAEALMETGEFERATEVLVEALEVEGETSNAAEAARARLVRLLIDLYSGSDEGWAERVGAEIDRSTPLFESASHHVGLATAARLRYIAAGSALRFEAAVAAAEAIIRHAEAGGDLRQQRRGALGYAMAALHGPTPVAEGIARCEALIASVDGDRRTQAVVQLCLAQLVAMTGDIVRARSLCTDAKAMLDELGASVLAASTSTDSAPIEVLAGDLAAAEALLRRDLDALERMGETYLRSSVAGLLARVLALSGHSGEVEALTRQVQELAAPDDVDAQILWRSALARQRARQGRLDEAMALSAEAVALSDAGSAPVLSAQSLADRAFVLTAAGRLDEAHAALGRAEELYVAKGSLAAAAALRASADSVHSSGS